MKKFLCKAVLFFLLIALFVAPVNLIIDPYQIFHSSRPVKNGVEPNKNYIKTKYILKNPEKFDSFLFGSSRAGFIDVTRLTDGHYYNMASSEALPAEHVRTLNTFLQHGIRPKNVIVFLDEIACFVDPKSHEDVLYRLPYPDGGALCKLRFYLKYMDIYVTLDAYKEMKRFQSEGEPDEEYTERFLATGTEKLTKGTEFTGYDAQGAPVGAYWVEDYYSLRVEETIADIERLAALCEEYDINVRFVVNPVYRETYVKAAQEGYLEFLDRLADTVPFYSFCGINDVTMTPGCYYEASHFVPEIGDAMLYTLMDGPSDEKLLSQGFGIYVTKDNKEAYMRLLDRQLRQ